MVTRQINSLNICYIEIVYRIQAHYLYQRVLLNLSSSFQILFSLNENRNNVLYKKRVQHNRSRKRFECKTLEQYIFSHNFSQFPNPGPQGFITPQPPTPPQIFRDSSKFEKVGEKSTNFT